MHNNSLCWTCSHVMTERCPKHENSEIEKKMVGKNVYNCSKYDYDGECLHCALNTEQRKGALYDTCPYFIKGCKGYCSQQNFALGNYEIRWVDLNG